MTNGLTHMSPLDTVDEIRIVVGNRFTTRHGEGQPGTFGFGIVVDAKGLRPQGRLVGRVGKDFEQIDHDTIDIISCNIYMYVVQYGLNVWPS